MAERIVAERRMKLKPAQSAAGNARVVLPKMARKYFEAGRKVIEGKRPPDELHGFRLKTKQFRYTLELFRPVYGPSLDRYLKALRELQGALGKVSDYQSIQSVLEGDGQLNAEIESSLKAKLKDLRQTWRVFDAGGELKRWRTYLASDHSKRRTKRTNDTPARKPVARAQAASSQVKSAGAG
jgi:CHAD domain-containing protein